jgi:hypothetical protein
MYRRGLSGTQIDCILSHGVELMSEKHLIQAISVRYKALPRRKRVAEVRKFAGRSGEDTKFWKKNFPDLYQEAFRSPSSSAGARAKDL